MSRVSEGQHRSTEFVNTRVRLESSRVNTTKSSLDCEYLHVKDKNSEVLNFQRQINFTISSEPSTLFLPQTHRNNYITYEKIHLTFHLGLQSLGLQ